MKTIIVSPGQAIRARIISPERPEEILVRFNRENILSIFSTEQNRLKFLEWLRYMEHTFEIKK